MLTTSNSDYYCNFSP